MSSIELSSDEEACLLIMAEGGILGPIGRWEQPVKALHTKGFATRLDDFNYRISKFGRERAAQLDKEHDAALGGLIERSNQIGAAQKQLRDFVEQTADLLAQIMRVSICVNGDSPSSALDRWIPTLRERALELLREKR